MGRKIFVNLPVADVQRSQAFFRALGFAFNPQFTDEKAACLVISQDIFAMLLTRTFFQTFTSKTIADTRESIEVLLALDCGSRAEVDDLMRKAVAAGGKEARPAKDHGFMYEHAFEDPDGHTWELFWMDPAHVQPQS